MGQPNSSDLARDLDAYAQSILSGSIQVDQRGLALPDWAERRVAAIEDPKYRFDGWLCLYGFCRKYGDQTQAEVFFKLAEELLDLIEKPDWRDTRLKALIYHRLERGEQVEALAACEHMQVGPKKVHGLLSLVDYARTSGDEAHARSFLAMAQEVARSLEDPAGAFDSWLALGWNAMRGEDPEGARSRFRSAQDALARIKKSSGSRQSQLAFAWKELGEPEAAEAVEREIKDPATLLHCLTDAARKAWLKGQHDVCRSHLTRLLEVLEGMRGTIKKGDLLAGLVYAAVQYDQKVIAERALASIKDPERRVEAHLILAEAAKERAEPFQDHADIAKQEAVALPEGLLRTNLLERHGRLFLDPNSSPEEDAFFRDMARVMRGEELSEMSDD